jgi:hypothetical protein
MERKQYGVITRMCADGIERKMTIAEFFDDLDSKRYCSIQSRKQGEWIKGAACYCMEHIDKDLLGTCVQDSYLINDELIIEVR